jgi:phage-related protein
MVEARRRKLLFWIGSSLDDLRGFPDDVKRVMGFALHFAQVVYVLHAFQKKSKRGVKTPQKEMELVRERLKRAEEHYGHWRKEKS